MSKHDSEKDPFTTRHAHDVGEHHAHGKHADGDRITQPTEKAGVTTKKTETAPPEKPKPADLVAKWQGLAADQHTPSEHRQVYGICARDLAEAMRS